MDFKIDENLPTEIAEILIENGYGATTVYDEDIAGCSDRLLAEVCMNEHKILITLDLDFSDIRIYDPKKYHGIIILRFKFLDKSNILKNVKRFIPVLKRENPDKKLMIVNEKNVRVRE